MLSKRPKIKPVLTSADRYTELAGRILFAIMWLLTFYYYFNLPEIIPIHFNAAGEVDEHGNKITIFILPFIGTFLYAGLSILNNYPEIFNYPVTITEDNAEKHYTLATRFLRLLNILMVALFLLIGFATFWAASGNELNSLFIIIPSFLFTIPIIIYIVKATAVKKTA